MTGWVGGARSNTDATGVGRSAVLVAENGVMTGAEEAVVTGGTAGFAAPPGCAAAAPCVFFGILKLLDAPDSFGTPPRT